MCCSPVCRGKLILVFSFWPGGAHSANASPVLMVILRAISSSSQSVTVLPSATFPSRLVIPAVKSKRRHQLRFSGVAVTYKCPRLRINGRAVCLHVSPPNRRCTACTAASSRHLSNRQRDAGATWLEPTDYAETCLSSIAPHSRGDRRFRPCRKEPLREIPHPPRRARTAAFRRAANSRLRIRDPADSRQRLRRCKARRGSEKSHASTAVYGPAIHKGRNSNADFTVARRR